MGLDLQIGGFDGNGDLMKDDVCEWKASENSLSRIERQGTSFEIGGSSPQRTAYGTGRKLSGKDRLWDRRKLSIFIFTISIGVE